MFNQNLFDALQTQDILQLRDIIMHQILFICNGRFFIQEMVWQWEFLSIIPELYRRYVEASLIVNLTMRNNTYIRSRLLCW